MPNQDCTNYCTGNLVWKTAIMKPTISRHNTSNPELFWAPPNMSEEFKKSFLKNAKFIENIFDTQIINSSTPAEWNVDINEEYKNRNNTYNYYYPFNDKLYIYNDNSDKYLINLELVYGSLIQRIHKLPETLYLPVNDQKSISLNNINSTLSYYKKPIFEGISKTNPTERYIYQLFNTKTITIRIDDNYVVHRIKNGKVYVDYNKKPDDSGTAWTTIPEYSIYFQVNNNWWREKSNLYARGQLLDLVILPIIRSGLPSSPKSAFYPYLDPNATKSSVNILLLYTKSLPGICDLDTENMCNSKAGQCFWANDDNKKFAANASCKNNNCCEYSPEFTFDDISLELYTEINTYNQQNTNLATATAPIKNSSNYVDSYTSSSASSSKYVVNTDGLLFQAQPNNDNGTYILNKVVYDKVQDKLQNIRNYVTTTSSGEQDSKFPPDSLYNIYYNNNKYYYYDNSNNQINITPRNKLSSSFPIELYSANVYTKIIQNNCQVSPYLASIDSRCCSLNDKLCLIQYYSLRNIKSDDNITNLENQPIRLLQIQDNGIILTTVIGDMVYWYNWKDAIFSKSFENFIYECNTFISPLESNNNFPQNNLDEINDLLDNKNSIDIILSNKNNSITINATLSYYSNTKTVLTICEGSQSTGKNLFSSVSFLNNYFYKIIEVNNGTTIIDFISIENQMSMALLPPISNLQFTNYIYTIGGYNMFIGIDLTPDSWKKLIYRARLGKTN